MKQGDKDVLLFGANTIMDAPNSDCINFGKLVGFSSLSWPYLHILASSLVMTIVSEPQCGKGIIVHSSISLLDVIPTILIPWS